ncbi:MAG: DNA-processing protein DprA [Puniceicoccales bacterium]|jgi:DNA processing protein|nr:DNA-processing protein DprA [Puniceicoccales bacterium]
MAAENSAAADGTDASAPLDARTARLVLNALPNIGPVTCRRLMDALGDAPTAIFRASRGQLCAVKGVGAVVAETILQWRTHFSPARELEKMATRNIRFTIPEDGDAYPALLREIYDPPLGLYATSGYKWGDRCIGIVGSRRVTAYGKSMAHALAHELAASGWCVVSGLARGIDTAAHQGALAAGGATVAVLGCGLDIVYPPENLELYRQIAATGAVVSEFFLGRQADRQTFPMRNRLISGMSRAIVVVESDVVGGSMITARFAAEQNRTVCAVPGRADQPLSRGCHALIRDGATLVTCVDEILEELGEAPTAPTQTELNLTASATAPAASSVPSGLGALETKILQCLSGGLTLGVDTLAEQTQTPVPSLIGTLLMMELNRLVVKTPDGRYETAR